MVWSKRRVVSIFPSPAVPWRCISSARCFQDLRRIFVYADSCVYVPESGLSGDINRLYLWLLHPKGSEVVVPRDWSHTLLQCQTFTTTFIRNYDGNRSHNCCRFHNCLYQLQPQTRKRETIRKGIQSNNDIMMKLSKVQAC